MFTALLANTTVKDQTLAQDWYTRLFDRGPEPGGGQRILRVTDPDGNRIVFAGE